MLFYAKKQHDLNVKIPKDLLLQNDGESSEFLSTQNSPNAEGTLGPNMNMMLFYSVEFGF